MVFALRAGWRNIAHYPAHDRCMRQRNASLRHHFHGIAEAQLETKVPAEAKDDDPSIEMAPLEKDRLCSASVFALFKAIHG